MRHIYLMRAGTKKYKIGVASNVRNRRSGVQTGSAEPVDIVIDKQVDNALEAERKLHEMYSHKKANGGREWFNLTCAEALDVCVWIHKLPDPEIGEIDEIKKLIQVQVEAEKKLSKRMQRLLDRVNSSREHKDELNLEARLDAEAERAESVKSLRRQSKDKEDDDMYAEAIIFIDQRNTASTSMLQRHFAIGYGRASRLMDRLESDGFIGPLQGSSSRNLIHSKFCSYAMTGELS